MSKMNIHDYAGNKRFKVYSESETFTLIDGFYDIEDAISFAKHMLGSFNNVGSSGQSEQYTTAHVFCGKNLEHTFTFESKS